MTGTLICAKVPKLSVGILQRLSTINSSIRVPSFSSRYHPYLTTHNFIACTRQLSLSHLPPPSSSLQRQVQSGIRAIRAHPWHLVRLRRAPIISLTGHMALPSPPSLPAPLVFSVMKACLPVLIQ